MQKLPIKLLFIILVSLCCGAAQAQSRIVEDLSATRLGHLPICLYPSTLRMLNLSDNHDLNEVVRDIKHIKFLAVRPQIIPASSVDSLVREIVEKEDFTSVMTMSGVGQELNLLMHERKSTMVLITVMEGSIRLVECKGKINPMQLIKAFTALREDPMLMNLGLDDFFTIGQDMQSWD